VNHHAEFKDKTSQQDCLDPLPEGALLNTHIVDDLVQDEVELTSLSVLLQGIRRHDVVIFADAVSVVIELDLRVVLVPLN